MEERTEYNPWVFHLSGAVTVSILLLLLKTAQLFVRLIVALANKPASDFSVKVGVFVLIGFILLLLLLHYVIKVLGTVADMHADQLIAKRQKCKSR